VPRATYVSMHMYLYNGCHVYRGTSTHTCFVRYYQSYATCLNALDYSMYSTRRLIGSIVFGGRCYLYRGSLALVPGAVMFDLAMSTSATHRRLCMRWNKTETHIREYTKFFISYNYTLDIFFRDSFLLLDYASIIFTNITYIVIQSMTSGNKRMSSLKTC
jgi:hypothetical protein